VAKELSVAPKERINIKYVPATGDQQEEVELPLKMVVMGDFTGRADETPVEERSTVSIDKNNFNDVLREMDLERTIEVQNTLSDDPEATLSMSLDFKTLKDFDPDAIAQKVPELKNLVDLREALIALKGPLGNMPQFRKALAEMLGDEEKREEILKELSITSKADTDTDDSAPEA